MLITYNDFILILDTLRHAIITHEQDYWHKINPETSIPHNWISIFNMEIVFQNHDFWFPEHQTCTFVEKAATEGYLIRTSSECFYEIREYTPEEHAAARVYDPIMFENVIVGFTQIQTFCTQLMKKRYDRVEIKALHIIAIDLNEKKTDIQLTFLIQTIRGYGRYQQKITVEDFMTQWIAYQNTADKK